MSTQTLQIRGMTCAACVIRVEKALSAVPGVDSAVVNLATNLATINGGEKQTAETLVDAVRDAGYDAAPVEHGAAAETLKRVAADAESNLSRVRKRLIVGAIAAVPVLLIDFFHTGILHAHSTGLIQAAAAAEFVFASVVVFFSGKPFFTGAIRAVRHGAANMDFLVALGSGVAYVYSVVLTALTLLGMRDPRASMLHPEYHAAAAIIVLVLLGKFLEARAKKSANNAVASLASVSEKTARRLRGDDTVEEISADQIVPGDRIEVLAHQTLPVDGNLIEGTAGLDLSVITGESAAVEIGRDAADADRVLPAGGRLLDGRIVLRATASAADSTISRILTLVQTAQAGKTQIQSLADRIAGVFVPIVLLLAAVTMAGWFFFATDASMPVGQRFATALIPAIATIVIACPCAMGLATPTAITVAVGAAARRGILFTRAGALERAGKIAAVAFDKTGTLTSGKPAVASVTPAQSTLAGPDLLGMAASVEQFSDHPLARAIVAAAERDHLELQMPTSFNSIPGGGVKASFADSVELAAGSLAFITSLGVPNNVETLATPLTARGETLVVLADLRSNRILGFIGLRDTLRTDSAEAIAWLRTQRVKVAVLSGDSTASVQGTLANIPVDVLGAGLQPDEKAAILAKLRTEVNGPIAFVGDGINDAPALAAADLGIAMAAGTDLAKSSGDILLVNNRLSAIPEAWRLSRRTLRIIKQNLFWAFAYNVAAIPLAMLGRLPPEVAAGAMILSSLTVVLNALRLYR